MPNFDKENTNPRTLYMREWRKNNLEKNRKYYRDHHAKYREQEKTYRASHVDHYRDWRYQTRFGISLEDYKNMWIEQQGKCKICGGYKPIDEKTIKKLCVDHDYETGKVRGLICFNCNAAIGHFKEDINLLKKAIAYITESSNFTVTNY